MSNRINDQIKKEIVNILHEELNLKNFGFPCRKTTYCAFRQVNDHFETIGKELSKYITKSIDIIGDILNVKIK